MTASEGDKVPSQHNHGTGIFISGDNFGDMVDEKTKALLEKMAKQSPKLAKLLEQAFQDGFISPEAVAGMERAARSINEDVAVSLQTAAKNINEDVAFVLADAARKIASHVGSFDSCRRHPQRRRPYDGFAVGRHCLTDQKRAF